MNSVRRSALMALLGALTILSALAAEVSSPQEFDMPSVLRFYNGRVLRDHEIEEGELWVCEGKVIAARGDADEEIDLSGRLVVPGFIDLQINGGFGYDFSSQPGVVSEVARRLPQYGVTSFLPTVVSTTSEGYRAVLPTLQPRQGGQGGAEVMGIHLEGPFLSPERVGCHRSECLQAISERSLEAVEKVYGSIEGVKYVTLAPELPGALSLIAQLRDRGIVVAVGHSDASAQQLQQGVDAGISMVTHLFDTMRPFHHRDPGIVGVTLSGDHLFYSMIVDGKHLDATTMRMAWKAHPAGAVIITDAMEASGLPPGQYRLGGNEVEVNGDGAFVVGTQQRAGSIVTMDQAVRIFCKATGCSLVEAFEAASLKPATVLGIEDSKGSLHIGGDADFVITDDDLHVYECYVGGQRAFKR